jgi:hypothetical protein
MTTCEDVGDEEQKINYLLRSHASGFDTGLATAEIEKVFKVWTQGVNDENVVKALLSKMVGLRHTD